MSNRRALLLTAGLFALACIPLANAQPVRPGRQGGLPTSRPAPLSGPMQSTRLQLEFYRITCAPQRLGDIDVDALTTATPQEILDKLGALGEARILGRIDQVGNLVSGLKSTSGKRMPTTQNIVVREGKVTPSVTYEEVGTICDIVGDWRDGTEASVNVSIEVSQVVKSPVVVAENVRLPAFETFKLDQQMAVESGKPVVLLTSDLTADLKDAESTVLIVRLRLTSLSK